MTDTLMTGAATAIPEWTKADRLKKAREFAGLEQTELAALTGLSRQTISNYERGFTEPKRSALTLWSLATGVDLEWISGHEKAPSRGGLGASLPDLDSNQEPADYRLSVADEAAIYLLTAASTFRAD